MIIAISGSVGVGKTTISKMLAKLIGYEAVELNKIAEQFKLKQVKNLQTFDFDINKTLEFIEKEYANKNVILEGHFSHLLSPDFVDVLIIVNRDTKELYDEYVSRGYNEKKIQDNLEVENFNVCFYEAEEEGYVDSQFIVIENNEELEIEEIVYTLNKKLKKKIKS